MKKMSKKYSFKNWSNKEEVWYVAILVKIIIILEYGEKSVKECSPG